MAKKRRSSAPVQRPQDTRKSPPRSKLRRNLLLVAIFFALVAGILCLPQAQTWIDNVRYGEQKLVTSKLMLPDGTVLKVELARTPEEQEIGLMFRKALAPDRGMIFIYDKESSHTFWMKNTLIDLDMVFIGTDKRVKSVAADVPHTTPETPDAQIPRRSGQGQYILEIPAGQAKALGIKPGTQLAFSF